MFKILKPYPFFVEIEVTTKCNLKCILCEHTYWTEKSADMNYENFKNIIEQFPNLIWIGLTGIGESFMHKDFLKMLRYVKKKPVIIELYDTFYFIDKKIAKTLIALGVDKIFASIDAATKETYEKIRKGSNFERVINNVKTLFELKRRYDLLFPQICFHYIFNKYNVSEIPEYVELVHSLGVDKDAEIQFTRMLHSFKETEGIFTEIPEAIYKKACELGEKYSIKILWNKDAVKNKPLVKLCTEWSMPFIFVNGDVIPCCAGNEANQRQYQKDTSLGNIFKEDFKDIWWNDRYTKLRELLSQNKIPTPCNNCSLYNIGETK